MHFGVTTGYFQADAEDITPGGTFSGTFQVPFAGMYANLTKGNFFADAQVRWDFFENKVTDPANGLSDQAFDARSTSVTANVGYRFDVGSKSFIEPSVGGVWSRTEVDPLNVTRYASSIATIQLTTETSRCLAPFKSMTSRAGSVAPASELGPTSRQGISPGNRSQRPACFTNSLAM